jgi:dTDP-4-amino-4,6-dideoxygalactose transaminase
MTADIYHNNREFERLLCEYTGAPYAIAVDNCCNALFLCLRWQQVSGNAIARVPVQIPRHTYIGVPYAIKAAGFKVEPNQYSRKDGYLQGEYQLNPYPIFDYALRFTTGMYEPGTFQCLSFTGPYKHLRLGKAGAILCDNEEAATWLRRAAFSGRNYVSYHDDTFDMQEGYNMYLPHTIAALGVQLMQGMGRNPDLCLTYPDWSLHPAFNQ